MASVSEGDQTLWLAPEVEARRPVGFAWLPAFDEFVVAYADRSAVIPPEHQVRAVTKNGIFSPLVLVDGVAVGVWKWTFRARSVEVSVDWFEKAPEGGEVAVAAWSTTLQGLRPPG